MTLPLNSPDRIPVTAVYSVAGTTPELRAVYRHFRQEGLNRHDSNLLIIGMAMYIQANYPSAGVAVSRKIDRRSPGETQPQEAQQEHTE